MTKRFEAVGAKAWVASQREISGFPVFQPGPASRVFGPDAVAADSP